MTKTINGICPTKECAAGAGFTFLRITPTCGNQWVAASCDAQGGSTGAGISIGGIPGMDNKCPGVTAPGLSWGSSTLALVDSTIMAPFNCSNKTLNTTYTISDALSDWGCGGLGNPGTIDFSCFCEGSTCGYVCPSNGLSIPPPSSDNVIQFITQICAAPCMNFAEQCVNLSLVVPSFPFPADPTAPICGPNGYGSCTGNTAQTIPGQGTYNPVNFTLGTYGWCSQVVNLIWVGCQCSPTDGPVTTLTIGGPCTVSNTTVSVYRSKYYWAPVKFSLVDARGYPNKFTKCGFLRVDPALLGSPFDVYFAQTRSCNGINVLLKSHVVDLGCLYWCATVFVITAPTNATLTLRF